MPFTRPPRLPGSLFICLLAPALLGAEPCLPVSVARVDVGPKVVHLRSETGIEVEFNRATGTWRRTAGPPRRDSVDLIWRWHCYLQHDSIVVAPGVRVVRLQDVTDGTWWVLRQEGSPRDVPVKMADRLRPKPKPKTADDDDASAEPTEFAPLFSAWLTDGDLVWFGLHGSESNAGTNLGGLLRYSMRTRALASFAPPVLRDAVITSMAVAGGTLWMGTQRFGHDDEYGPDEHPGPGLVQLGRDGAFKVISADSTPLPDDKIGAIGAAGDTLWVVTARGVAMLDTRVMRWDVRWFRNVFTVDSTYVNLITQDPEVALTPRDRAREASFIISDVLQLNRDQRARLVAAASQIDPDNLGYLRDAWLRNEEGRDANVFLRGLEYQFVDILRDPLLVPFVREALRDGGSSYLASSVLSGQVPDTAWRAAMRSALRTARLGGAVSDAAILLDSGDVVAKSWLREKLADPAAWDDSTADDEGRTPLMELIFLAGKQRDPANLPALLDMLAARPRQASYIIDAIWSFRDAATQAAAGHRAAANPRSAIAWLRVVMHSDSLLGTPAGIAAKREAGEAALRYLVSLSDPAPLDLGDAPAVMDAIADVQDAAAIPLVLQLLDRPWLFSDGTNEALIRLSGLQPPRVSGSDVEKKVPAFWKSWWASNAATFRPVPVSQGMAALERWKSGR